MIELDAGPALSLPTMLGPDKMYLKATLERIEAVKAVHDQKFSDNPVHKNCLPNFDRAIDNLKKEILKLESASQQGDGEHSST